MFPPDERYGLTGQIRRAAASIQANIAAGCGREGPGELRRFRYVATGSASERDYHLLLTRDLGLQDSRAYDPHQREIEQVKRMLTGLIANLSTEN